MHLGRNFLYNDGAYDSAIVYFEESLMHDPDFISAKESLLLAHYQKINLLYPNWMNSLYDQYFYITF